MRARKLFVGFVALLAVVGLWGAPAGAEETEEHATEEGAEEGGHAYADHAAEECVHILEDGGTVEQCQEAPNPILPATNEIIWGGLAFIILFGLLAKLGLPAIQKSMEERTAKIQGDLDAAEAAKAEQTAVLERYNAQLAEAKAEAARIVEEARQSADGVRRDLIQRAEQEAAELRQRNAEQLTAERERLMGEVQGQVATLAIELAERVVEGNLDRYAQMRLIDSYIANVGSR
jgi:F-type H+-transporting ATPase subunit b